MGVGVYSRQSGFTKWLHLVENGFTDKSGFTNYEPSFFKTCNEQIIPKKAPKIRFAASPQNDRILDSECILPKHTNVCVTVCVCHRREKSAREITHCYKIRHGEDGGESDHREGLC